VVLSEGVPVNRRDRRANGQRRRPRLTQAEIRCVAACPDCNADVDSVEIDPNVHQVFVYHDETCPWLTDFQRRGGYGVRFGAGPW
jgi:hypothetical protein